MDVEGDSKFHMERLSFRFDSDGAPGSPGLAADFGFWPCRTSPRAPSACRREAPVLRNSAKTKLLGERSGRRPGRLSTEATDHNASAIIALKRAVRCMCMASAICMHFGITRAWPTLKETTEFTAGSNFASEMPPPPRKSDHSITRCNKFNRLGRSILSRRITSWTIALILPEMIEGKVFRASFVLIHMVATSNFVTVPLGRATVSNDIIQEFQQVNLHPFSRQRIKIQ